ncbi:MAG: hypothetical protein WBO17_15485 [Sphingorhabdus sp.]
MAGPIIWGSALVVYGIFRLWYDNIRGRLQKHEIDAFMSAVEGRFQASGNDPDTLRSFLEADDGREFVMLNLVKAQMGQVEDPKSGQPVQGIELLQRYSRIFMRALVCRGGHPGMIGRKVGGYIDAWNTAPDPGWTVFGLMRYRSRRDLMRLVLDPAFKDAHLEKILGTLSTFSFPTQRVLSAYASPRLTMFLVVALAAALIHITLLCQTS